MTASEGIFIWAERGLLGAGIAMLAWCFFVVGEAWMIQTVDLRQLQEPTVARELSATASRLGIAPRGAPLAQLRIPRLGLSAVVLEGDDDRTLRSGPGHIAGTPLPGQRGNVAIAGHRDTFFRPLRGVRVGDEITLVASDGRFRYRVSSLRVVGPTDLSVLAPTARQSLTLVTCYPFSMIGHAPYRFIVRAQLVDRVAGDDRAGRDDRRARASGGA
jgi:sortase A